MQWIKNFQKGREIWSVTYCLFFQLLILVSIPDNTVEEQDAKNALADVDDL